jgi:hypothetical protein
MRQNGGGCIDPWFLYFDTSWGDWLASRPCRFTLEERAPGTIELGGWVDTRVCLDDMEKWNFLTLPGLELRPLSRSALSQSL